MGREIARTKMDVPTEEPDSIERQYLPFLPTLDTTLERENLCVTVMREIAEILKQQSKDFARIEEMLGILKKTK